MSRSRLLALALAGLLLPATASAETLRVPQDFANIQAAVDAATQGDEVLVSKGVYLESVQIVGVAGLSLRGKGAVIDGSGNDYSVVLQAFENISITGFVLTNSDAGCMRAFQGTDLTLERVRMQDADVGMEGEMLTGLTIEKCRFTDMTGDALEIDDSSDVSIVKNRFNRVDTGFDGVTLDGLLFERNVLTNLTDEAFEAGSSNAGKADNVTFRYNKVRNAADDAVNIEGDNALVSRNVLANIDGEGVYIEGNQAVLEFTSILRPTSCGFEVQGEGMRVEKVRVVKPDEGGYVSGAGAVVRDVRIVRSSNEGLCVQTTDGVIERVTVSKAGEEPFELDVTNTLVSRNKALGASPENEDTAFEIDGSGNTVEYNVSTRSGQHGFEVDGDNSSFFHNKAVGAAEVGFRVSGSGNTFTENRAAKSGELDLYDQSGPGANTYVDNNFKTELINVD